MVFCLERTSPDGGALTVYNGKNDTLLVNYGRGWRTTELDERAENLIFDIAKSQIESGRERYKTEGKWQKLKEYKDDFL